jgi:hypothetical protein
MARIDYAAIQSEIKTVLNADPSLAGVTVELERDSLTSPEQCPWVGIYLERRQVFRRPIAAGTRMDYKVFFILWCYEHSMDTIAIAAQLRDDLLGKVEVALMKNTTLNGRVVIMTLSDDAGEFEAARTNAGFLSGGSTRIEAVVKSTTS